MNRLLPIAVCAAFFLGAAIAEGTAGRDVLAKPRLSSHGMTVRNPCFAGGMYQESPSGPSVIVDPTTCESQKPLPRTLPVHKGGTVRVTTKTPAEKVTAWLVRRGMKSPDFVAAASGSSGTRWRLTMPHVPVRGTLSLRVDYTNGEAGFNLPIKRHRHR